MKIKKILTVGGTFVGCTALFAGTNFLAIKSAMSEYRTNNVVLTPIVTVVPTETPLPSPTPTNTPTPTVIPTLIPTTVARKK